MAAVTRTDGRAVMTLVTACHGGSGHLISEPRVPTGRKGRRPDCAVACGLETAGHAAEDLWLGPQAQAPSRPELPSLLREASPSPMVPILRPPGRAPHLLAELLCVHR